jgi:hypothetical protein
MEKKVQLILALRRVADKLESGAIYMWGHMGACNCGNLAQELTSFTKDEIHTYAMQRPGEWKDQLLEFCPNTGFPFDLIIERMLDFDLNIEELRCLEELSDPRVLSLMGATQPLKRNKRDDVIAYLRAFATLKENQWIEQSELPQITVVSASIN